MSDEQVWVKNTDENSTDLYMLSTNLDSYTEYDYYSKNDNDNIENLVNLTYINLPSIMNVLQTRYDKDNIYTFNGEILISINPFKTVNIYNNKILSDVNSPHIYSIAEKAYHNLVDKNQSILVSGESGSGKTENTKYILRYLCNNYSNNKELAAKIINSNYIIELFGNAKTIRNQNSSRFGKFIKLYLEDYNIIGANIENYLLEKSRISFANKLEKTYHIFYLVCNHREELNKYGFRDQEEYKLLKNSKYTEKIKEFDDIDSLFTVFKQFSFDESDKDYIFSTLKLILEMLNCENKSMLTDLIAGQDNIISLLRLDKNNLLDSLTKKKLKVSGEIIIKDLTDDEILVSIKTFCEDKYEEIFSLIINKISVDLGKISDKYIGILDIFGFEVFDTNGYEQLCINYTNEMLQQIFNQYVFKSEQLEYEKENLNWHHIDYVQNDDIVEIFNGKISLFSIINEQTILGSGNDSNIYGQFEKHIPESLFNIDNLKRKDNIFSIKHFTGKVDYKVDNYVLKNRINSKQTKVKTNLQYFSNQLNVLKEELSCNNCYFIRCIKPNNKNVSDCFNQTKIYNQLLYSGIIEGIKIVLAGYPIKKLKQDINNEFRFYSYYNQKKPITELLDNIDSDPEKYQIGSSKIFMKSNFYKELHKKNRLYQDRIITVLQKNVRRYNCVRKYYFTLYYIIKIQSLIRQYLDTLQVQKKREFKRATIIAKNIRRYLEYKKYKRYKLSIIISKNIRRHIQYQRYKKYRMCTIITKNVRIFIAKKILKNLKYIRDNTAALTITFWLRRIVISKKIFNRNAINKITIQLEEGRKDILKLKDELEKSKNEVQFKNSMLISKDNEIKELRKEVSNLKNALQHLSEQDDLLLDNESSNEIKKNMDNLILVNETSSIDIIENYNPDEQIVNNTLETDDDYTKDIPIKSITVNSLYNIPLSSDSDNELSLNKDDVEYIQQKKLEQLGAKMEKLYLELQNKKQIIDFMRSKHMALQRAYEKERLKKSSIWEVVQTYFK